MVTVWWLSAVLIHYNFLNLGETIMAEKYCQEIDEMHRKLQRLRLPLVNRKDPIFLNDNARSHVTQSTLQKLKDLDYETLLHPPYSPDLSLFWNSLMYCIIVYLSSFLELYSCRYKIAFFTKP